MYIKTPSAAAVDRRHIFFYFGTLNYRLCGRSRAPNRRAVHHRCFIFAWEIHFSRWATLDCHAPFGTDRCYHLKDTLARTKCATGAVLISAGNHFPPQLRRELFTVFYSQSEGRILFFFFFLFSFQVQSKRVNQKLQSKVSELYSQPTAATLIRRRLREKVEGRGDQVRLALSCATKKRSETFGEVRQHPGSFFITFAALLRGRKIYVRKVLHGLSKNHFFFPLVKMEGQKEGARRVDFGISRFCGNNGSQPHNDLFLHVTHRASG